MKKHLKKLAGALLLGILLAGTSQAKQRVDNIEYEDLETTVGQVITKIATITFPADEASHSIPTVRVYPYGIAEDDEFYATMYLFDAEGKIADYANNYDSFHYTLKPEGMIVKGEPVTYTLAVSARYYPEEDDDDDDDDDENQSFWFEVGIGEFSGPRDFELDNTYFYTSDLTIDNNWNQANIWFYPSDSVTDSVAKPGELVNLLALRAEIYTVEKDGATIVAPTFRVKTKDSKPQDLLKLQLASDNGVISTKPKVSNRGKYLLVEFPETEIKLPEGISSLFLKGKANASLKETNIVGAYALEDNALPITPDGQVVDSSENHQLVVGHTTRVSAKK
jgi:hypothetical protein